MIFQNKIHSFILYTGIILLFTVSVLSASEFESGEHVHISNIHNIDGDLYMWGERGTIDGEINGDLIGGGENIEINGLIENSANIFANKFTHSGEINGTLRLFVNDGNIDGFVGRSGLFFCNTLDIGKNAEFNDDIFFRGGYINLEGTVHGDVDIYCGSTVNIGTGIKVSKPGVYISGTIDGDVTIHGDKIHIISPALIKGNLKYISKNQATIDINSGVTILGTTTWDLPENAQEDESDSVAMITVKASSKLLASFLVGLILMLIGKKYVHSMVDELQNRSAISAAVGFIGLALLVVFIILLTLAFILLIAGFALSSKGEISGGAVMLAISTILIPLSSIVIVSLSAMLYCGKIILALLLGFLIVNKLKGNSSYLSKTQLFIGLLLLYITFEIPYIGTIIFFVISLIGTGAIILGFKNCDNKKIKGSAETRTGI